MFSKHIVIQKIESNNQSIFYQATDMKGIVWSFETNRSKSAADEEFFPFKLENHANIRNVPIGSETKIHVNNDRLTFYDNYAVPGGFVIGILLPQNFVPTTFSFNENPVIPIGQRGQAIMQNPGSFSLNYNSIEKRCAVIFHTSCAITFGFKINAKKVDEENYPRNSNKLVQDNFDIIIDQNLLPQDHITQQDLSIINETIDEAIDLNEISRLLNELLDSLNNNDKQKSNSIFLKLKQSLINGVGITSGITTIIDSYNNHGVTGQFIARIFEMINK